MQQMVQESVSYLDVIYGISWYAMATTLKTLSA